MPKLPLLKKIFSYIVFCLILLNSVGSFAQAQAPDTVKAGIYITSIHDIDFKQEEYTIDFWLWLKYKNQALDFDHNLELPQAKNVNKQYLTVDSSNGRIYMLMKLQCVMRDSWKIGNFPFDEQRLRLSIENSQFDSRSCVFVADTLGKHYDPRFVLSGWKIDSCLLMTGIKPYETAFGDESFNKPHSEYGSFRVRLVINRSAAGLFWKMFLGMYIAFLIGFVCLFIHADGIDSRFTLSVGALFAVVGNKYIIDASLPETTSFTLVDSLHGLTLFCIFSVIAANAYSLKLYKKDLHKKSMKFDKLFAIMLATFYLLVNILLIVRASP